MENTFGGFLRKMRLEKNLTQKELAHLLFVSESTVSKWEKNVARPDITLLPKLSEILGVTEHELITASIDDKAREEKAQAKKWRAFSLTWSWFFYIAYALALIPCFICDLAINKGLTWFWIVFCALILAFTFTNLPKLIKKRKLLLLPLCEYLALVLLFGVCCIYTNGNWFWIPTLSVLFALITVFVPIYISKYDLFNKIRKVSEFVSVTIDFIALNVLLIVINGYTLKNGYSNGWWYFKLALPIVFCVYLALNVLFCVKFLKINRALKTSLILFLTDVFMYLPPIFIKARNPLIQNEIKDWNVFNADLSRWQADVTLAQNVNLIICLTLLSLALAFLIVGLVCHKRAKTKR